AQDERRGTARRRVLVLSYGADCAKKRGRAGHVRPKSREETPKEGMRPTTSRWPRHPFKCATHKVQANCFALQKHGDGMARGAAGKGPVAGSPPWVTTSLLKKKGRPEWPCSPSLGRKRPRWARRGGSGPATTLTQIWARSCCAATSAPSWGRISGRMLPGGNSGCVRAATLEL